MASNDEKRRIEIITRAEQSKASINELSAATRLLMNDMKKLPKGSEEFAKSFEKWKQIDARLKAANAEIRDLDGSMKNASGTAGKFWSSIKQTAAGVAVGNFFSFMGSQMSSMVTGLIESRKKISDELTNIAKTTNMTEGEVAALNDRLKDINTRSSRSELRQLAAEAGKLGKTGVEEVAKFVKEMDQIKIALGEDLGENAVIQIGKMTNVYDAGALQIASAVNSIGAASEASEQYLVDFAARLGGSARTAKISAPDIIGYGAVLDQMGLQVEMSSTALSNFVLDFVKDTPKFEAAANIKAGGLQKMLGEKGTNAGLIYFIEKLKESTKSEGEFLQKLEQVGIDGSRGAAVFLTLANNIDEVKKQQALANSEFEKGTSITDEFNKKNNNFAANMEKLGKTMSAWFSDSMISKMFEGLVGWLANTKTEAESLTDAFLKQQSEVKMLETKINPLLDRYDDLKSKATLNKDEQAELKKIINEVAEAIPTAVGEFDKYGNAMSLNTDRAREFVKQQALALKSMNRDAIQALNDEIKQKEELVRKKTYSLNDLLGRKYEGVKAESQATMIKEYRKTLKKLQEEIEQDKARLAQLQGDDIVAAQKLNDSTKKTVTGTVTGGTGGGGGGGGPKKTKSQIELEKHQARQKEIREAKEALKAVMDVEEAVIKNSYLNREIEKEEYAQRLYDNELKYLEAMRLLQIQYQESTAEIDVKIADHKIKQMDKVAKHATDKPEGFMLRDSGYKSTGKGPASGTPEDFMLGDSGKKSMPGDKPKGATADQFGSASIDVYQGIIDLAATRENAELAADKKILDSRLETLEAMKNSGKITDKEYQDNKLKLEKEYNQKQADIKRKQFERNRIALIAEAVMNTAVGVTKALTVAPPGGFVLAGLVGAAGALQIANLVATPVPEFQKGGSTVDVTGQSGRKYNAKRGKPQGYYNTPAYIVGEKGGEYVIPNWLYTHPSTINMMNAIDAAVQSKNVGALGAINNGESKMMAAAVQRLTSVLENGIEGNVQWDDIAYRKRQKRWEDAESLSQF